MAMLLIIAGAIILLYNTGAFGSILFSTLMPIVLIAFGFDLLTEGAQRRRAMTGALLAAVVLTPLMAVAHFVEPERSRPISDSTRRGQIGNIENIDRVRSHVKLTAGRLSIGSLDEDHNAVVVVDSAQNEGSEFRSDNRVGILDIDRPIADELGLSLTQRVPVNLKIEMGVGDAAPLDFEGIKLESLDLTQNFGTVEVTLPDQGVMEVTITKTAGELEINVPDDLAARIEVESQASEVDVDERFELQDGVYVSEGYNDNAENRATIRINMSYGNIVIR
jgi:predicted membrane protein